MRPPDGTSRERGLILRPGLQGNADVRPQPWRCDVFCRVVDNFGDAGICWRLARQLSTEHGLSVRLWIDRPSVLARLGVDAAAAALAGVALLPWTDPWPDRWTHDWPSVAPRHRSDPTALPGSACGDLVIAAFGCRLPEAYLDAMTGRVPRTAWFNVEHLSAEHWVAGVHGLASPRPDRPLVEHFFVPGFDEASGGLLRERDLLARRDAFAADPSAHARLAAALGVAPRAPDELLVSAFCYPHAPLAALLAHWRDGDRPVLAWIPEGVGADALAAVWGVRDWTAGIERRAGRLRVAVLPFVAQPAYDALLWSCDVNIVRGEDSAVRAQWAARPWLWQPYRQADGADRTKLEALLARVHAAIAGDPAPAAAPGERAAGDAARLANRAVWSAWSAWADAMRALSGDGAIGPAWDALVAHLEGVDRHAADWCATLSAQRDLCARLLDAARKML